MEESGGCNGKKKEFTLYIWVNSDQEATEPGVFYVMKTLDKRHYTTLVHRSP